MDRICKRIVLFVLGGLVIGGASSSIVLANTKPVETNAAEDVNSVTKTEDATLVYYTDVSGWCYRTLHLYNVSYNTGYSASDFENFLTVYYGPKVETWEKQGTTRGWGLNGGTAYDYMIHDGGESTSHTFEFPWWVAGFKFQIVNNDNWIVNYEVKSDWGYHAKLSLSVTGTSFTCDKEDNATYAFPAITISKMAIDSETHTEIIGSSIPSETSVTFNKYPNGSDAPADPTSIEKYTFDGWYLDINLTQAFTKQVFSSDTIIYAKFNPIKYTIQFDANGGSGAQSSISTQIGNTITLPECTFVAPTLFEKFVGWKSPASEVLQPGDMVTYETAGTYTYTAQWERMAATATVNSGSPITLNWNDIDSQYVVEHLTLASGDEIDFLLDGEGITWDDGTGGPNNLRNHKIKKPGTDIGLYLKIEDGSITGYATLGDVEETRQFVIDDTIFVDTLVNTKKSPVEYYVHNLEITSGSEITLAYEYRDVYNVAGYEKHDEVSSYFNLTDGVITCNHTGKYDLYMKTAGGGLYDRVYIEFCAETKATNYAKYFNDTLKEICSPTGATVLKDLEDAWSQTANTNLAYKYSLLNDMAKAYFSNGTTPTIEEILNCVTLYDFIITKYKVGQLSDKITNFMNRTEIQPKPVGPEPINPDSKTNGFVILASVLGASVVLATGAFVAKKVSKKKEQK